MIEKFINELVFDCFYEDVDLLSDAFMAVGGYSVTVEDADAGNNDETPIFGEPGIELESLSWKKNRLSVLFLSILDPLNILYNIFDSLEKNILIWNVIVNKIVNVDWVSLVQSNFVPFEVTNRIVIIPGDNYIDEEYNHDNKKIYLKINPGMAFGTGSHPTTSLCLSWLDSNFLGGSVLDYGCGSGILSIAAMKLGASNSVAVDIDHLAIDSTINNAKINDVLVEVKYPHEILDRKYELVIANILERPLKNLAEELCSKVCDSGFILLSGILSNQINSIQQVYSEYINLSIWKVKDDWACLYGRKEPY